MIFEKLLLYADKLHDFLMFRVIPVMLLLLFAVILYDLRRKRIKSGLKHGKKKSSSGVIFGKHKGRLLYSPVKDEGHIAVLGGSGLGKTSALLIPTLKSWTGSSLSIDISGDICKNVDCANKLIYEPASPCSIPYNIFGTVDQLADEDEQNEALEQLAMQIMPDEPNANDTTVFFTTEGRKILTATLIAFYHSGFDFIEICEKVVFNSWEQLFTEIDESKNDKAIRYINGFQGANEKNTAGCKQSCDTALKLFATNEKIKKTIRRPAEGEKDFTPADIETHNVFIVIDDNRLKLYAPLLQIITAQSLEFFSGRENGSKQTILFCLDEFASFGRLDITDALRKLRKKNVRIMVLTQSLADIDLIYGKTERAAMLNNFKYKVVLGASDVETQEYFAKLVGYHKTKTYSKTSSSSQTSHTEGETREFIIEPAELNRLGNFLLLLYPGGHYKLRKNFYFKN